MPTDPPPTKCPNGHEWSNQFGEDWTPDRWMRCDCGALTWGDVERKRAGLPPENPPPTDPLEGYIRTAMRAVYNATPSGTALATAAAAFPVAMYDFARRIADAVLAAERQQATAQQEATAQEAEEEIRQLTLARDEANALIARYGFGKAEAEVASLTAQLQELAAHVQALHPMDSRLPETGHEASFIVHTTNHLADSRKAALAEVASLTQQLAAKDTEIVRLRDDYDSLTGERFSDRVHVALREQLATLQRALTEAQQTHEALTEQRDGAQRAAVSLQRRNERLRAKNAAHHKRLAALLPARPAAREPEP